MFFNLIWILLFINLIKTFDIIKGSKALLSSNTNYSIPKNKCKEIKIPNNFKKIKIYTSSNEINEILLTDKIINSCDNNQSIYDCCNINSTFCLKETNPSNNYYHIYNCMESSYIYACGNNNENISSSLNIKVFVIKEEGCQIEEYDDEVKCGSLPLSECNNESNIIKKKHNSCQYVECLSENNEKLMGLCLPKNYTDDKINEKCSYHANYGENGKFIK